MALHVIQLPVWSDAAIPPFAISSGNVTAATATATVPLVLAKSHYITNVIVTGAGATGASVVSVTLTGLIGGTLTWPLAVPAGATVGITPLIYQFPVPLQGILATAVVLSMPTLGAGNLHAAVTITGFTM